MATLAEQLRNEMGSSIHTEIPWLKQRVLERIKHDGEFSIICDRHINDISTFSIPYRYWSPIEDWARSEGFRCECRYNSYGVKHLCISL